MAAKDGESTFRINIDGNASVASKDIAASSRLAAKAIAEFETEAKTLSADLRRLKGNSEEVNAAKTALKKRIEEVKASTSALTVQLAKQGTTYTAAAAAAKKYGDGVGKLPNLKKGVGKAVDAATNAVKPIGKKIGKALAPIGQKVGAALEPIAKKLGPKLAPVGRVFAKFGSGAKKAIGAVKEDAASVLPSLGSVLGVVASGAALAAAAIAAVGVAGIAAGTAIVAFGIASASAAAKMQRQREAILGNAKDAEALGEQIGALAGKVPQGVEELNELGRSLSKTRLSGKAIVDTMGAVAQATGAIDAEAGAKLQELITRGQQSGRFYVNQLELQGTGIDFDDIAKEYAAGTKKGIDAARRELMTGGASIEDAAAAIRKATEKKFGDINLKNAFSLENAPTKLKEQLGILSKGVDLSPISKALQDAFGQLSPDAPLGAAIKTFMETTGAGFVDIAATSIPVLVEGFKWLLVWALKLGSAYYEMKKKIKDAFAEDDWIGVGKAIVTGLVKGVLSSNGVLFDAIKSLGKDVKKALVDELKIHSPSKVFEGYGRNTVEGYAQGVERSSERASGAVQNMVEMPTQPSGGAGSPIYIEVNIHGAPTGNAQQMQSPEFLAALTRALRDAVSSRGLVAA